MSVETNEWISGGPNFILGTYEWVDNVDFLQTCVVQEKLEAKVLRQEIVGLSALTPTYLPSYEFQLINSRAETTASGLTN